MARKFRVSDKVVCVKSDELNPGSSYPGGLISEGAVYCVQKVVRFPKKMITALFIVGKPVINRFGKSIGWKAERFKLLAQVKYENGEARKSAGRRDGGKDRHDGADWWKR